METYIEAISQEKHYHYNVNLPKAEVLLLEHEAGRPWKEIAEKYKVSEATVWSRIKYFRDHPDGLTLQKILSGKDNKRTRQDLDTQTMIVDYLSGMSALDIAVKYDCGKTTVRRRLKKAGVKFRSGSEAQLVEADGTIRKPKRISTYEERMILDNKYSKMYYSIIEKAGPRNTSLNEYYEKHHVHPKALGGSNDITNLVKLTPKEHYICHRLLTKCTSGDGKRYMVNAWSRMSRSPKTNEYLTSTQYSELRKQLREVGMSEEHRAKIGASSRGRKHPPRTEEQKAKMSEARKKDWAEGKYNSQIGASKKPKSEETKKKMSEAAKNRAPRTFSEEAKNNMSDARKENWNKGTYSNAQFSKPKSDKHKENIRQAMIKKHAERKAEKETQMAAIKS